MGKKINSVDENKEFFEEYFREDLDAIEEELTKSKSYSEIIDAEIKKLSAPSLGTNKGGQHFLIEHITNAVQLQTQRQGLRRDRFAIKKAVLDYASKFLDNEEGNDDAATKALLEKLLARENPSERKPVKLSSEADSDLDAAIDSALDGEEKN